MRCRAWRLAPMALHLSLVAIAGIYLPGAVVAWFRHVASHARVGAAMLKALFGDLSRRPAHRGWPRVAADSERWRGIGEALREGKLDLLGLWGDRSSRALRAV